MQDVISVVQKVIFDHGMELVDTYPSYSKNNTVKPVYLVPSPRGTTVCFSVTELSDGDYFDFLVNVTKMKPFKAFIFELQQQLKIFEGFEPEPVKKDIVIVKPSKPTITHIEIEPDETEMVAKHTMRVSDIEVRQKNIDSGKRDLLRDINQTARHRRNLSSEQTAAFAKKVDSATSAIQLVNIKKELDATVKENLATSEPVETVILPKKTLAQQILEMRAAQKEMS